MANIILTRLTEDDREQFILDNQYAFKYGAMEEFGERDNHFEEDGEIISRKTIENSIDHVTAYVIREDDGTTVVTKPTFQGKDEAGKNNWQDVKTQVPNTELKAMVEAYKVREPQAKEAQHRASARDELNALVKDTAVKVAADKPKSKTKTKKGPEL